MSISKKQQACVHRYIKAHYDRLQLVVPRGYRDAIQTAAQRTGKSRTAYMMDAIRAALDADGVTPPTTIQDDGDATDQDGGGG